MTHFIAPPNWQPDFPNPFSADGGYAGWSCFQLLADDTDHIRNGCEPSGFNRRLPPPENEPWTTTLFPDRANEAFTRRWQARLEAARRGGRGWLLGR